MDNQPNNPTTKKQKIEEYRKLREIFDQKDKSGFKSIHEIGIDYESTEVGIFLPADIYIIDKLFQDLISTGFIDPRLPFLDAGSGDARVSHLAVINGIKHSIGIEYSPEIIEKSKKQTTEFENAGIIEKGCVHLIEGDFTEVETYTKERIDVKNIKTFFNYINGWKELLSFIDKNSFVGTKMILIDEQFNVSDRITKEIPNYKTIELKETLKYIYRKGEESAELVTPELLKRLKEIDGTIENQHIHLNVSSSGQFSIVDTNHRVVTIYLFEKIS